MDMAFFLETIRSKSLYDLFRMTSRPMRNPNFKHQHSQRLVHLFAVERNESIIVKKGNGIDKAVNEPAKTPYHEVEALTRVLLPEIQAFFESEEWQKEIRRMESAATVRTTK